MFPFNKAVNPAHPYRMYQSQFPGEQSTPLGFWGNDFGGDINKPVLKNYTVVGYMNGQLWLQSKTGDSSDSIQIEFMVDRHSFNYIFMNKVASFAGNLTWDGVGQGFYYQWTCTNIIG